MLTTSGVTASPAPSTSCGDIVFEIVYTNGSTIDASVFTFDDSTDTFSTETSDVSKARVYGFIINTNYDGYVNPQSTNREFTITLIDTCALAVLQVDPVELSSLTYSYMIGDTKRVDPLSTSAVTASPTPTSPCAPIVFEILNPIGHPPLSPAFIYDNLHNTFTTDTSDLS